MSFQEPNQEILMAYSGWAISKKSTASDEQHLALAKFQDGCESLAQCCPASMVTEDVHFPNGNVEKVKEPEHLSVSYVIPKEVLALTDPNMQQSSQCSHRFHIQTQRCVYCGQTYLQAKGRLPELM